MIYAFAILAALIVATGEVVQQRMAAQAPPQDNLSPRLLLWLVRQPRWLAGVGCSLAGNVAFAAALSRGSVVLVEAVFLVRLLFGLLLSALWSRRRLPRKEILGGLAITAGLVAFLLAARPRPGTAALADLRWAPGVGVPIVLAVAVALVARSRSGPRRALLLGVGGGILFGVQASLVSSSVRILGQDGASALAVSWHGYAVVVVALLGMLLVQSAFESAALSASYPGIVTAQLLTSIAMGVAVLQGRLNLGPIHLLVILPALALMVLGVFVITRSPFLRDEAGLEAQQARPETTQNGLALPGHGSTGREDGAARPHEGDSAGRRPAATRSGTHPRQE